MKIFFILVLCLVMQSQLGSGRAEEGRDQQAFPLSFHDGHTEGSWVYVLRRETAFEVEFARHSNAAAIEALAALHPYILNLNATGDYHVYLVGELVVKEDAAGAASPQRRGEFRLDGWYIKAPFLVPSKTDPENGLIEVSKRLEPSHFLPAGEREGTEATKALRASLQIHHDERLNVFWIGAEPPVNKLLKK
ncbi:hypothetical protein [Prosthecobacter sp.]|uniref:hypothetical protein n=1 Tax=Prosthecobacter sp. TaxID=1965333 RepID=UPI003783D946